MKPYSNQTYFNWGFWDAVNESKNQRPRTTISHAPHNPTNVSKRYCPYYYGGYVAGLEAFQSGNIPELSDKAWENFQNKGLTATYSMVQ